MNEHHSIKVEATVSETKTDFLDITIFKGPNFPHTGILDTKMFFKPTDSHSLLHKKSFHPKHVFSGIIKSQLLRFSRICTRTQDRDDARKVLFTALRKRGYSRGFLQKINKSINLSTPREKKQNQIQLTKQGIPLVTTYSTAGKRTTRMLQNNFKRILKDTTLDRSFKIIPAYRRNPTLQQLLVRAKLPKRTTKRTPYTRKYTSIKDPITKHGFKLPTHVPPTQENCVYFIKCTKCGKKYVGETRNGLNTRLNQHKYIIRKNSGLKSHLVNHFQEHGRKHFTGQPLEHNPKWTTIQRKKRERFWIHRLNRP